ncbi:DUF4097 domain-containing protein [Chloracidobacterium thermophilum]|uniref:DUF4097 domain-containing protein n=1 Tax=Chloracidobacterium thermophilum TaxID=458033 RepID=UPI0020176F69|nr:DUF4097 domain-containing protein [Chloracidobacterium thermophilum]
MSTFSGEVRLSRLENEVVVETTSGNVFFVGALTPVKRCTINALSGDIRLAVPETCGFEMRFRSFSGALKSDFPVDGTSTGVSVPDTEPPSGPECHCRRVTDVSLPGDIGMVPRRFF